MRSKVVAAALLFVSLAVIAEDQAPPSTLRFGDVGYHHRWSGNGQNEFTPEGQDNLEKWQDMITINVHESVTNGEQLADLANKILTNYQRNGKILRTESKPRSGGSLAEHLVVAVLGDPNFLEVAFTRVFLKDGVGFVVVSSHRTYGKNIGPEMSAWLKSNGPSVEAMLMSWGSVPRLAELRQLPQSTTPAPDKAALIKKMHDLTHLLVRKDATFGKSIQELLPKGVTRMPAEDFSKSNWASSAAIGKSHFADVKKAFGEPIGESKERDGHLVYSYDAPKTIVTYLFNQEGVLEASYGYVAPW